MDAWVTDSVSLGAFGRIQVVEFAHLFGGRLQYRLKNNGRNETRLRLGGGYVLRSTLGAGQTREFAHFDQRYHDGWSFCVTGGFIHPYRLSDGMKFKSALDYIHLVGTQPSYHFDVTLASN